MYDSGAEFGVILGTILVQFLGRFMCDSGANSCTILTLILEEECHLIRGFETVINSKQDNNSNRIDSIFKCVHNINIGGKLENLQYENQSDVSPSGELEI